MRAEFDLFDVFYTDGTRRSNRRVPREILGGLDGDAPARAVIEERSDVARRRLDRPRRVTGRSGALLSGEKMPLSWGRHQPWSDPVAVGWRGCTKSLKSAKLFHLGSSGSTPGRGA